MPSNVTRTGGDKACYGQSDASLGKANSRSILSSSGHMRRNLVSTEEIRGLRDPVEPYASYPDDIARSVDASGGGRDVIQDE